ncbi:aspartate-tRNA ligase cytoplasmic-like, partial [Trifolium medium]|nr:aspartate-tRNA ligase cytoplasmic-like [Trifolium medium]
ESVGKEEKLLCQQEIGYPEIPMVELQSKSKKTNVNKWTLHLCQEQIAASTAAASDLSVHEDPLAANYGDIPLVELQSKTIVDVNEWTPVENLDHSFANQPVKIRGRVHSKPLTTNNMTFLVIREFGFTVRCLVQEQPDSVSFQMVKYAAELIPESIVDVEGVVFIREAPIKDEYAQQVEIQVRKLHCVSRATSNLPINLKDAAVETEKAIQ